MKEELNYFGNTLELKSKEIQDILQELIENHKELTSKIEEFLNKESKPDITKNN